MADNRQNKSIIYIIAECALMVALGTVLAQIKIYRMPQGGSVTAASMVPFLMASYRHGGKWGILTGFTNSLLQMLTGGIYPPVAPGALGYAAEVLFDYVLAYMVVGFADVFFKPFRHGKRMLGIGISTFLCCFLRFLCAFLSGVLVWADLTTEGMGAVVYSLGYNGSYMIPETIITVIVICLIYKLAPKLFTRQG